MNTEKIQQINKITQSILILNSKIAQINNALSVSEIQLNVMNLSNDVTILSFNNTYSSVIKEGLIAMKDKLDENKSLFEK